MAQAAGAFDFGGNGSTFFIRPPRLGIIEGSAVKAKGMPEKALAGFASIRVLDPCGPRSKRIVKIRRGNVARRPPASLSRRLFPTLGPSSEKGTVRAIEGFGWARDPAVRGLDLWSSTRSALDIETILETYAGRSGIEVFVQDAKPLLGFAESQSRKEAAVLRIAPVVGLYSILVLWFADSTVRSQAVILPERPWCPHKQDFAFTDILRADRHTPQCRPFGSIQRLRELATTT